MDRLACLEAFVRVAESGTFSAAAIALRLPKSAVSRQVAALEEELGVRLINRTTRSLSLTEAGRGYLERASRILADIEDANRCVSQLQATPRGHLRISAPMSFGFLHLAPALTDFLIRYPEVSVDVVMNDRFVDVVEEGFDVAVRIGSLADSSLIARRLAPNRLALCASPAYLAQHGAPRTPEDLRGQSCLINSNIAASREWRFVGPGGEAIVVPVSSRASFNNGDAMRIAAARGLGFVRLPTFICGDDLRSGALVSVLADYVPQLSAIHAVYPQGRHLSPTVRAFVDFLVARFGPEPYWDAG